MNNRIEVRFPAISENEKLARMIICSFLMEENPTLDVVTEVRTAISEAVTNCIVHAYGEKGGTIVMRASVKDHRLYVEVEDFGCGIENIERAMEPFYTTMPEQERSGMGFTLMKAFMDGMDVETIPGMGTCVKMEKEIGKSGME